MRAALAFMLSCACGGPSQQQLAETPSATAPARPSLAPPASQSDKDRERSVQQFEDMQTTQNAYKEAEQNPPKAQQPLPGQPPAQPSKRKAPVEQAPSQP